MPQGSGSLCDGPFTTAAAKWFLVSLWENPEVPRLQEFMLWMHELEKYEVLAEPFQPCLAKGELELDNVSTSSMPLDEIVFENSF